MNHYDTRNAYITSWPTGLSRSEMAWRFSVRYIFKKQAI